jgi:hypothetical protein
VTLAAERDDERATTVSGLACAWTEQSQAMERMALPHTITAEERQRQRRAWESWAWQRVLDMAGVAGRELAVLDYRPSKVSSRTVHMQGGVALLASRHHADCPVFMALETVLRLLGVQGAFDMDTICCACEHRSSSGSCAW